MYKPNFIHTKNVPAIDVVLSFSFIGAQHKAVQVDRESWRVSFNLKESFFYFPIYLKKNPSKPSDKYIIKPILTRAWNLGGCVKQPCEIRPVYCIPGHSGSLNSKIISWCVSHDYAICVYFIWNQRRFYIIRTMGSFKFISTSWCTFLTWLSEKLKRLSLAALLCCFNIMGNMKTANKVPSNAVVAISSVKK